MARTVVYALGGNALSSPDGGDEEDTALVLAKVMSDIVDLLESGWRVVVTHGNGPQVGHLLELEADTPLDSWVAATQGMIGHSLSINLDSILRRRGRPERTAVLLTRVEVDGSDEGFKLPTKPVGPILDDDSVMSRDWDIAETIQGPRRVVASPLPMRILDLQVIQTLVDQHAVVICGGGGGIPIIDKNSHYTGVPAVIDKDRLSALLAVKLDAEALIISTDIDAVRTGFGTANEISHSTLSLDQCEEYMAAGEFPLGSMAPKIGALMEAALHRPGLSSILCAPGDALKAIRGETGTTIRA